MCLPAQPRLKTARARARWNATSWAALSMATGYALVVASLVDWPTADLAPLFLILVYGTTAAFAISAWGTLYATDTCFVMGAVVFPRRLVKPSLSWAGFYAPIMLIFTWWGFPARFAFYLPAALLISLVFGAMVALFADAES